MRVLLISANTVTAPYPVYPLGLDYVAGAVRQHHAVCTLDLNHLPVGLSLEDRIAAFGPDIIGLSIRNIDNTDAVNPVGFMAQYRDILKRVRCVCGAPVVLGGSGFTIFPKEAMAELQADYGIMGEGERLNLLLNAIATGKDPRSVPGVVTRGEPAALPPAPWSGPVSRYLDADLASYYISHGGMLNLQTKRGCPFKCIYCTYPRIEGGEVRCVAPQAVARTAVQLQAFGARYFFITDSAFNADIDHSLAVARAFRKAGVTIPWGAFFAPMRFPPDYFRVMAESGLQHVEFGTESLSEPVLAAYHKPFKPHHVVQAHQMAVAAGLHVAHYFLFGGPGETEETMAETFSGMEKLSACVFFIFCGMRIYPGTALHALAVRKGRCSSASGALVEPVFYVPDGMDLPEITRRVEAAARGRGNWRIGGGGLESARIIRGMHRRGYTGPLWDILISK